MATVNQFLGKACELFDELIKLAKSANELVELEKEEARKKSERQR